MLEPDHRRLYSECFAAPVGHVFDAALGTTYSLDLESLLFAHFCLATSGQGEPEAALRDPVATLEAIHRTGGRVSVFCHAGETNVPSQPQAIYALLEQSLVLARGRSGGAIFHPKLWVLRFRARKTEECLLRVVVLSRNLTTSRAWDVFVCLEGSPGQGDCVESRELAELVRALPSLAVGPRPLLPARAALLESLASDVERTRFEAPPPFEGVARFRASGFVEGRGFEPALRGERLLAISPFVSPSTLRALRGLAPGASPSVAQLVGRPEEIGKCSPEVFDEWEVYVLDDAASSDADTLEDASEQASAEVAPQGLHAKALVVESGRSTTWWHGSGNLTDPVRNGTSVELMVQLQGKTCNVGIDKFWESGFAALRVPYQHCPPPSDPTEGSRSAVEKAKRALCESVLMLRCEAAADDWTLVLEGNVPDLEPVMVTCCPVSLRESHQVPLLPGTGERRFLHLSMEALTAFLGFQLVAGRGEAAFELKFTLQLPIEGVPAGRDARIARAVLKDRSAFLGYLRCLLAEAGQGLPGSGRQDHGQRGMDSELPLSAGFASGLLESLLRMVHREPERLRGLRALLERDETEALDEAAIPREVRELWSAVEPYLAGDGRAAR